nr:hypothetical protein [Actinomycetota bacterium]
MTTLRTVDSKSILDDARRYSPSDFPGNPTRLNQDAFDRMIRRLTACEELVGNAELDRANYLLECSMAILTSCASDPVLLGNEGSNELVAFFAVDEFLRRNDGYLDFSRKHDAFRTLFSHIADEDPTSEGPSRGRFWLRKMLTQGLYWKEDDGEYCASWSRDSDTEESPHALIAPPLTGVEPEQLVVIGGWCDEIVDALGGQPYRITDCTQTLTEMDPTWLRELATDRQLVRSLHMDSVVRADLVIGILTRPSTGVGIVLAWADRVGAVQMVFSTGPASQSLLPIGSPSLGRVIHLRSDELRNDVGRFLDIHFTQVVRHREMRRERAEVLGRDLVQCREAFSVQGRDAVARVCPPWMPLRRVSEILRSVDHF